MLPPVADLIFLALLVSLNFGAWAPKLLGDAGIGWHIRNGEQMLRTHSITRADSFSSTMSGQPWYAWEWLYDVLIAAVHHAMGLNGVVFFTALVVAGTFALTLRLTLARGADLLLALFLLGLSMGACAIHLFARPHVLSWLLVVIWFQILDSWETASGLGKDRVLLWLPVLMLLWVNLHGGFLTGFVLLALYLASGLARSVTAEERARPLARRRLRHLGNITLLSLLATLVNPYGYRLHVHVFQYLSNRFLMNHIEEFLSPNFHGVGEQCFVGLLAITLIGLAAKREKPRLSEMLVILFAAGSGLYASRNLPVSSLLLTLVVAPILSRAVAGARANPELASWLRTLVSRCESFASRMTKMEISLHGHLWPAIAVGFGLWICAHGGSLGSRQLLDAHFSLKRFPVQATDQIARLEIRQPIFCPDYWGGYLIYRLYPQTKVMVDDRHDLYGERFFKDYLKVVRVEPGWDEVLRNEQTGLVLVRTESALANVLKETPEWRVVYEDEVAVLFRRSGG
jgi:hypothetical protein